MLTDDCRSFREDHEPGRPAPHADACPECRAWVEAIVRLRSAGADLPLPEALRDRLRRIPGRAIPPKGETFDEGVAPALPPLPSVPLPDGLKYRLQKIPAEKGPARRPWVMKARSAAAASYLLAALLTAALGSPSPETVQTATFVSRDVSLKVQEAGAGGTRAFLRAGDALFRSFSFVNQSLGSLMGRLGSPQQKPEDPRAAKAPAAGAHPPEK